MKRRNIHSTANIFGARVPTFIHDVIVPYEVYGAAWDGSLEVPTKDALYDIINGLIVGGSATWGAIIGTLSNQTDLQAALDAKVDENGAIVGATKTKITYDAKGLVTAGADATTADVNDSSNRRYVTDAQLIVIANTSGTNTGDQTSIVGITGTKAQYNTSCTDGDFLFVGDITQYTDEMAQDAVGNILTDTSSIDFTYNDGAPSITADLTTTGVIAGSYTLTNITVDAQGRITSATSGSSGGIDSLNTLIANAQTMVTGTAGTDFAISSAVSTHTFNLPIASAVNTGKLSSANWSTFNSKEPAITAGLVTDYWRGDKTFQPLVTTAVTEGTNLYFTDERAQDATGAMVTDGSLVYVDATPLLTRGALTGDVTASQGSNTTVIANDAVTFAKFQNITDNRLLGRSAGSSGDMMEILVGTGLTLSGGTLSLSASGVPTGVISMWGTAVAPTGYLLCDGTSYTTAGQAALFAVIGYAFGGAGANFNVPDFRQRFPLGKATAGTGSTLAGTGGAIDHTHQVTTGSKNVQTPLLSTTAAPASETLTSTSNNPPFLSINFIIKN